VRWDEEIEHRAVELDRAAALALADPCLCAGRRGPAPSSARRLGGRWSITFPLSDAVVDEGVRKVAGFKPSTKTQFETMQAEEFGKRLYEPLETKIILAAGIDGGDGNAKRFGGWPSHAP
jgi:hypothetical protein